MSSRNTLTSAQTNTYLNGLREWELAGGVKFVQHTQSNTLDLFTYNTNFLDYVSGGSYSPQIVTVLQSQPGAGLPRDGPLVRLQPRKISGSTRPITLLS